MKRTMSINSKKHILVSMLRTMVKHIQHNIQNFMRNNIKKHMLVSMKKYGQRIMLVNMKANS